MRHFQGRQRCLFGRFEHDRIAARNRRAQFPCHHHQGVIPRRDTCDHADCITPYHRGVACQIFARQSTIFVAHGPCEKTVAIDHARQFVVQGKVDRLAAINASKLAKSCASRSMRSAIRNRAAERSAGVVRDQWSDALRAAATARSTCAVEALWAPRIAAHPRGCYGSVRGPLALPQKMNPPAAMWKLRCPLDPSLFAAACGV